MPIQRKLNNVVSCVLVNSKNELLLQYRSKDAPTFPHYWGFFGGGINRNEIPIKAVKREAFEEINYHLKNPQLIIEKEFKSKYHFGRQYVFIEKYQPSQKITLKEGEKFGWFECSKIKKMKMIPHDKLLIDRIKKNIKN